MKFQNKLALYIAYYFSRFDMKAYSGLGFTSRKKAHTKISKELGVKANTLKNMRDEFDPLHNHRAGWYQRPLGPSRVEVVKALEDLDHEEIRIIISDILNSVNTEDKETINKYLSVFNSNKTSDKNQDYVLRGPTGKKAEEFFIAHHENTGKPVNGKLKDTRLLGCGYDFEILSEGHKYLVEVKGLSSQTGGISFTNKEWEVARKSADNYIVALVSDLSSEGRIQFIKNPTKHLNPKKNIYKRLQIQWSVKEKDLHF